MSENEDYSNYECPHPHDPDMYDFDLQRFFLIIICDILISKNFSLKIFNILISQIFLLNSFLHYFDFHERKYQNDPDYYDDVMQEN